MTTDAHTPTASRLSIAKLALPVGIGVAAIAIIVVLVLKVFVPDETADLQHDADARKEDMESARAALQTRLPMTTAMTFGRVFTHGNGEAQAVCGLVDIEEPDDGFDGQERFVYVAGALTVEEADGTEAVEARWRDACQG